MLAQSQMFYVIYVYVYVYVFFILIWREIALYPNTV